MLDLIPAERQAAVLEALQTLMGNTKFDSLHLLHGGGSSSFTYKIAVNQQTYVLRVMGLDQPIADRSTQSEYFI